MKQLLLSEAKNLRKYIVFYILILSLLYSVITSVMSFSFAAVRHIDSVIDELSEGSSFYVQMNGIDINEKIFNDLGFAEIIHTYRSTKSLKGSMLCSNRVPEGILYLGAGKFDIYGNVYDIMDRKVNTDVISGQTYSGQYDNGIWISKNVSDSLSVDVGDQIGFMPNFTDGVIYLDVIGILENPGFRFNRSDYIISEAALKKILMDNSIDDTRIFNGTLPDYNTCKTVFSALENLNIEYDCYLYTYIKTETENIYTACNAFLILSMILASISMCIFISFFNIVTVKRYRFIGILKSLGMMPNKIMAIYSAMSECIIVTSLIISYPAGLLMSRYLVKEFNKAFEAREMAEVYDARVLPVTFILLNIMFMFILIYLNRKINKISTVDVLREQ